MRVGGTRMRKVRQAAQTVDENGKIIIREHWDDLTKAACMAMNDGMTYGKWMALRYEKQQALAGKYGKV